MASGFIGISSNETHEQFMQRASRIFPADDVRSWSRVERGVFNYLLAPIVHKCSYSSITDEMLLQCRDEMARIIQRLTARSPS